MLKLKTIEQSSRPNYLLDRQKMLKVVVLSFTFVFSTFLSNAQIDISFPVSRIVFQRDLTNQANIPISGNLLTPCEYIEARLTPINGFQGTDTGWQRISNASSGIYQGQITAKGGWYELNVRAYKNGQIVSQSKIDRVGVGEVFVVAGQSNAEGNSDFEGSTIGVQDDRVSVINYQDILMDEASLPFEFTKLVNNTHIGPYNPTPWIWAVMAERIVKEYGVPVLLYGAAVGGTSSDVWYRSARGDDLTATNAIQVKFPGSPYQVLGRTLKNYVSRTGVRAVLWQQGESDFTNSVDNYYFNINYVIEQTRRDLGQKLPWIIAESSRTPNISFNVIIAQQRLIANIDGVYQGPETDLIVGAENRFDGIHFHRNGIKLAGNAWFEAIKANSLLSKINPIKSLGQVNLSLSCAGNQEDVNIQISNSNIRAFWTNGSLTSTAQITSGPIEARVYNSNGLRLNFPKITIQSKTQISPSIELLGESEFCEGSSSRLIANRAQDLIWQNGAMENEIYPTTSGAYSFNAKNIYGCNFKSNEVQLTVYPKPVPNLNVIGGIKRICSEETFTASLTNTFPRYVWSDSSSNNELSISSSGNYSLQVFSEKGCASDVLNFEVEKLEKPQTPSIERIGFFALKASNEVNPPDQLNWYLSQNLVNNTGNSLKASSPGVYSAKLLKSYQFENETLSCLSDFSNQLIMEIGSEKIAAYPNPSQGEVSVESIIEESNIELKLYTYKGQLISVGRVATMDNATKFNFPNVPNGTYILHIKSGYYTYRKPLIILK